MRGESRMLGWGPLLEDRADVCKVIAVFSEEWLEGKLKVFNRA
jgi:hypothetical protein